MEAVSDFFCDSLHLFCWYVFDVLCVHEFCMTISGKSWDHMDVRMRHAHSSNISDHPFRVHRLLKYLRDRANSLEVPSGFWDVPDPAMVLLRRDQGVSGVQRSNVEESGEILVLMNHVGGQFFSDNLAENAVLHRGSRFDWF